MKAAVDFLSKALASCFFLTYPVVQWQKRAGRRWSGSGFIGTLAGLISAAYLPADPWRAGLVLAGCIFISVAVSDHAEALMGQKDDQRIVIDEWAGYLASAAFLPKTPYTFAAAFILFRILDVWKPLGIRSLGKLPGGWGVVLDDLAAGVLTNGLLHLFFLVA
jgi:phosphatidylglycerophosphatase A